VATALWHGTLARWRWGSPPVHLSGRFRCGAADEGAAGLQDHEYFGGCHPFTDDENSGKAQDFAFSMKKLSSTGTHLSG